MNPLAVFAAMDTLVLERVEGRSFRCAGLPPPWSRQYWPECVHDASDLSPQERFPFLDVFLREAEEAWADQPPRRVESETWTQIDAHGAELHLQAEALRIDDVDVLLLSQRTALHHARQELLSRARELRLAHDGAALEAEQKDVLVHCIIHDLQVPLSTILSATSKIQEGAAPSDTYRLAGIALEAAQRQRALILDILQIFAPQPTANSPELPSTELVTVVDRAVDRMRQLAETRRIELVWNRLTVARAPLIVVGEDVRLERVVTNLIESALRTAVTTVTVSIADEGLVACVAVDDDGPPIADELGQQIFTQLSDGRNPSRIGLYASRITIERWGGTVGHEAHPSGGTRFWLRLPRRRVNGGSAA